MQKMFIFNHKITKVTLYYHCHRTNINIHSSETLVYVTHSHGTVSEQIYDFSNGFEDKYPFILPRDIAVFISIHIATICIFIYIYIHF